MAKFGGAALGLFRKAAPWFRSRAARGGGRRGPQLLAGVDDEAARYALRRRGQIPLVELRPQRVHLLEGGNTPLTAAQQTAMREGHQQIDRLLREAGGRPLGRYETRVAMRHVNPTGNKRNCAEVALAVDDILAGRAAVAGARARGVPIPQARGAYQGLASDRMTGLSSLDDVERLIAANPGARGIIVARGGEGAGHVYNVANVGGRMSYLDGQFMRMADTNPHAARFSQYDFYRTG
ncbi:MULTISPECIES: toxin glutamine deamidase domain-containing protein [unclassified Nonomuraea]|uniref:toxin glutamine deamidase domain-containing protein n=1 Tax=unclassified Nonomuraea TaxID=2593643 RepID=UPI0035BF5834